MKKLSKGTWFAICLIAVGLILCAIAGIKSCSYDKYAVNYMKGDSLLIKDTVVGKPTLEVIRGTYTLKCENKEITSREPIVLLSVEKL